MGTQSRTYWIQTLLKMNTKIRSSRTKRLATAKIKSEEMKALIIVNRDYPETPRRPLLGATVDGECMRRMLECHEVEFKTNVPDIERAVKEWCEKQKGKQITRLHFHYS